MRSSTLFLIFAGGFCALKAVAEVDSAQKGISIDDLQEISVSPQDGQFPVPISDTSESSENRIVPRAANTIVDTQGGDGTHSPLLPPKVRSSSALKLRKALREKVRQYQQIVDDLEFEYGPYHQVLEEALLDLANAYDELGDYRNSYDLYDRALHATRINAGLHSLEQVPVLKKLISSLIRNGDAETAVEKQRYFYWLHERARENGDVDLVPVLTDMVDWHFQAYLQGLGETPTNHLLDAYTLARRSANIARNTYGIYSLEMARLMEIMNLIDYEFYDRRMPVRIAALRGYERGVPERALGGSRKNVYYGVYNQQRGFVDESFVQRISDRNRLILGTAFSEYGEDSEEYYTALVNGIDWVLLLGRTGQAIEDYQEVYRRLDDSVDFHPLRERLFGRLQRLPGMYDGVNDARERSEYNAPLPDDPTMPFIEIRFNLSKQGRTNQIHLSATNLAEPEGLFETIRQEMRSATYRPMVSEGQVVGAIEQSRLLIFPHLDIEIIEDTGTVYAGGIPVQDSSLEWDSGTPPTPASESGTGNMGDDTETNSQATPSG